jgi:hypothetical protein
MIDLTSEEKMYVKMAAHNDLVRSVVAKHLEEMNKILTTWHPSDTPASFMLRLNEATRAMLEFCGMFK